MVDSALHAAPPKPRLVLRIGVTGHRAHRLESEAVSKLAARLKALFGEIAGEMSAMVRAHPELFDPAAPQIRIISPLAEGSDRLVARVGLEMGFDLVSPLPFARDDYERDFLEATSKKEFRDLLEHAGRGGSVFELVEPRAYDDTDNRAYQAIGVMTLRQCDLLIAIWDGARQVGPGGTGEVVLRASDGGLPVVWLDASGNAAPQFIAPKDQDLETQPLREQAIALSPTRLKAELETLLLPPGWKAEENKHHASMLGVFEPLVNHLFGNHSHPAGVRQRLLEFFGETERRKPGFPAYSWLLSVLGARKRKPTDALLAPYEQTAQLAWKNYLEKLNRLPITGKERIANILLPRAAWIDGLSVYYSQVYRNSYVANFLLAALAVGMAAASLLLHEVKPLLVLLELAFIVSIVWITARGAARRWHERWIDYRHLAELTRHLRVLMLTGSSTAEMHATLGEQDSDPGAKWVNWYYRATARELGMFGIRADAGYVAGALTVAATTELAEQIAYHEGSGTAMERAGRSIDALGAWAFLISAIACLFFLGSTLFGKVPGVLGYTVTALTAFLPAFGAAMLGIRFQADFASLTLQSQSMREKLRTQQELLLKAAGNPGLRLAMASNLMEQSTETMVSEVTDWRFVFRGRPLTLPS